MYVILTTKNCICFKELFVTHTAAKNYVVF